MAEPSHPVAVIPAHAAAFPALQRALADIGPVWPCPRAEELGALVARRRIRLVLAAPRDPFGTAVAQVLAAVSDGSAGLRIALLYPPTITGLADARAVVETGACDAYLLEPAAALARTAREILSPRWQRGPEHVLAGGLLRPLRGTAEAFGTLAVLHPSAEVGAAGFYALTGLHERRVERDFARSFPRGGAVGAMTPHRFARLALGLSAAWWLAHGRTVDQLVTQLGFPHRFALAERVKKSTGRPPGSFSRPRHFREACTAILRSFPAP
jgi:hypothetical protein